MNKLPMVLQKLGKAKIISKSWQFFVKHDETILIAGSIAGSSISLALMYKNAGMIHDIIRQVKVDVAAADPGDKKLLNEIYGDAIKELVPLVLPIAAFYGLSIGCAIGSRRASSKKVAALTAAYSVAENTISEYEIFKKKAAEAMGEEKTKEVEKETTEETIGKKIDFTVKAEEGEELFVDPYSYQVVSSTKDKMQCAMLKTEKSLRSFDEAMLNDFYANAGFDDTSAGEILGWMSSVHNDIGISFSPFEYRGALMYLINYGNRPEYLGG